MTSAPIDLDALEAVAKALLAAYVCKSCGHGAVHCPAGGCNHKDDDGEWCDCEDMPDVEDEESAYLGEASPDVVLALIARVREAEIALGDVHALLTNAGVEDPEVSHREGYALSLRALAMVELCRQQRDAAIEQRDAARAEVAAMAETLTHAAHARGAVEEYPDGTDELSLALERAEKAEAALAETTALLKREIDLDEAAQPQWAALRARLEVAEHEREMQRERAEKAEAACAAMRACPTVQRVIADLQQRHYHLEAPFSHLPWPSGVPQYERDEVAKERAAIGAELKALATDAGAPLLAELHALRAEVEGLRKVRAEAEAYIASFDSMSDDVTADAERALRAALDAKGGG